MPPGKKRLVYPLDNRLSVPQRILAPAANRSAVFWFITSHFAEEANVALKILLSVNEVERSEKSCRK
jgi:hypothetical protein